MIGTIRILCAVAGGACLYRAFDDAKYKDSAWVWKLLAGLALCAVSLALCFVV